MKKTLVGRGLGFVPICVVLLACGRNARDRTPEQAYDPPGPELPRGVQPLGARAIGGGPRDVGGGTSSATALLSMVMARCDREVRCEHIGAGETYGTRRDCLADRSHEERIDLSNDTCPDGISAKGLDSCLQSIREENCNHPLEAVRRLNACRAGNLCLR
jgi:hypothetical protein